MQYGFILHRNCFLLIYTRKFHKISKFSKYFKIIGPFVFSLSTFIIQLSNLLTLSVHDEGYSRNASCALNLTSTSVIFYIFWGYPCLGSFFFSLPTIYYLASQSSVSDEGYSRNAYGTPDLICTFY